VLEVTGSDVSTFCNGLVKNSKTYTDIYQKSIGQEVTKSIKKFEKKNH
jgi:DNA-binding ferritin-like protein (Dps family)